MKMQTLESENPMKMDAWPEPALDENGKRVRTMGLSLSIDATMKEGAFELLFYDGSRIDVSGLFAAMEELEGALQTFEIDRSSR